MVSWNDGICMSRLNRNNKNKRCTRTITKGSDFCRYHKHSAKYYPGLLAKIRRRDKKELTIKQTNLQADLKKVRTDAKIDALISSVNNRINKNLEQLDSDYAYCLMGMVDSWKNVKPEHIIKIGDEWWDIEMICSHYAQQLNTTCMENPYPVYPSSPFTRKLVTPDDINHLRVRLLLLNMKVNVALAFFMKIHIKEIGDCHEEASCDANNYSEFLLDILESELRFKLINRQDSQSCFTGMWVLQNEPESFFENMYDEWRETPYQLFTDQGVIDNPRRAYIYGILLTIGKTDKNDDIGNPVLQMTVMDAINY